MLKKIIVLALFLVLLTPVVVVTALWLFEDVHPADIPDAFSLVTGMGAKLACSAHHLSGFDAQTIEDDLATYSPAMRSVSYRQLEQGRWESSYFGMKAIARYQPGLGCTLDFGETGLEGVEVPAADSDGTAPWPLGALDTPLDEGLQREIENMLAGDNAAGQRTRALLVTHGGRILAEAYGPGITRDTQLLGWSMGKSVTAIMQGKLELLGLSDASQSALFTQWESDARNKITMENLLQMTSGLDFVEDYVPGSDSIRMLFMSPRVATVPLASQLEHEPGSHFYYSSGSTNLIAQLVFDLVGGKAQSQVDFFYREIAAPLGLENTTLEPDSRGVVIGSSFVWASARDWARFGQLMLQGGEINGARVLSADWVARAIAPNTSANDPRYGYQIWLNAGGEALRWPSLPADAYAMQGNRRQIVMVIPSRQAVLVRLGWSSGDYPFETHFEKLLALLPGDAAL